MLNKTKPIIFTNQYGKKQSMEWKMHPLLKQENIKMKTCCNELWKCPKLLTSCLNNSNENLFRGQLYVNFIYYPWKAMMGQR